MERCYQVRKKCFKFERSSSSSKYVRRAYRCVVRTKTSRLRPGPLFARSHSCGGGFSTRSPSIVKNMSTLQSLSHVCESKMIVTRGAPCDQWDAVDEAIHEVRIRTFGVNQSEMRMIAFGENTWRGGRCAKSCAPVCELV
jgi:hypothetical protein